jgi:hypothetical protein
LRIGNFFLNVNCCFIVCKIYFFFYIFFFKIGLGPWASPPPPSDDINN